jgi:flagellar biogenesis protein FliO
MRPIIGELLGAARSLASCCLSYVRRLRPQPNSRKLRVCEMTPLGEKRFLAIVDVEGRRVLIGGTANSLSMLTVLSCERDIQPQFSTVMQRFETRGVLVQ